MQHFRRLFQTAGAFALVALLSVVAASCGSDIEPLPDAVTARFDLPNNPIATVSDSVREEVPEADLLAAAARAKDIGADLRIVIAGESDELIDARSVVERYGGLALSYKSGDETFNAAGDMSDAQLDRAIEAAAKPGMGVSAMGFVDLIANEGGVEPRASGAPSWLWLLLLAAVAFLAWQAFGFYQTRQRVARRAEQFEQRRSVLLDWAQRLVPEINTVAPHASRLDLTGRQALDDSRSLIATVSSQLQGATSLGELDASEIRIARTAIKLRTMRQALNV